MIVVMILVMLAISRWECSRNPEHLDAFRSYRHQLLHDRPVFFPWVLSLGGYEVHDRVREGRVDLLLWDLAGEKGRRKHFYGEMVEFVAEGARLPFLLYRCFLLFVAWSPVLR
jgi:hypothetical protein